MHARLLTCQLSILAALALVVPTAQAQAAQAGLQAAVEAAWQKSPQARTLEARRNEIAAGREAAQSWLAGSPEIGLAERSDRWTDRNGAREAEMSVSVPVWLPGQQSARQALARRSDDDLEARIASARLDLAGEVRDRAWAVAAAREAFAEALDHQGHLEAIAAEVMRRVGAGDLARTDGMLARQEVLAAKAAVAREQAKLQEATVRYATLTGQSEAPPLEPESLVAAPREPHPKLLAAQADLQRSRTALDLVDSTRSDPPRIGLSVRRERESGAGAASRSLGIAVQIPIGTNARNRPLEAAARTQIASATAEAAQADAALRADIDLARQQLAGAGRALEAASARAALTREHAALIANAFRLGERGLADLLRAQALSHEADAAARQQKVALGLAHARLNQALGVMP